jgi:uncharacterized membrane protein YphA (DoxX/SURF4 family)
VSALGVVARPLLAGIFVYGGLDAVRSPESKVPRAEKVTIGLSQAVGTETSHLIRLNGAVQVAAGVALGTGIAPRIAALALAGSLVPTTVAGHAFWDEKEPAGRRQQTLQFLKNAAMFGGLLLIAADGS